MGSAAPIVWNNYVVCEFGSKYVILDATTGAVLKTFVGSGAPDFISSTGNLNCTPTIANVTISGTPTNVLFLAGGSVPSVSAYNMDVAGFPQIWSINSTTLAAHGFPGALGNNSYANFVKLTLAGNERLFFATGGPRLYSVDATNGNLVWGPITLDGAPFRGMATDGANLFLSTNALVPSNPEGDVYSINATTGAINWQLSTAGGLKGQTIFGAANASNETFPNGIAYAGGELYTVSGFYTVVNNPADGVFYRINSTTGAVLSAVASQCVYQGNGAINQGAVLVDAATILAPTRSGWVTPPLGNQMLIYNRFTGAFLSAMASGDAPAGTYYNFLSDGAMSCETGAPDWSIVANNVGYVSFFLNGTERFNRRLDFGTITSRGAGIAIGADQSVYVGSYAGSVYKLTKQADRPRLEIVNYFPTATTYGPLPSVMINFGKVYTNTGSGVLTGTITIDNTSNGSTLGAPGQPNFDTPVDHAASIADQLTNGSTAFTKAMKATDDLSGFEVSTDRVINRAAAALPSFINPASATIAINLAAGDSANLILDVKQNAVSRGPNVCYGWFASNDPDFFINNPAQIPQVKITVVGGCVTDTTALSFGAGATNLQWVTNNGRLGTGDWTPHAFNIEANVADFYQGTYVYGVSKSRLAMNTQDWSSGGGETNAWISMQGDPNICNTDCKPLLLTSVSLGQVSTTGLAYTTLTGSVVCRSFVDSVQNFATGFASWNWRNWSALFDADSTMGLKVDSRVIGFVNAPAGFTDLNNVTVDMMKIVPRYNLPLNNWKMGEMVDYDLGGDTVAYDASISAAWSVPTSRATGVWGAIKLPFGGCGTNVFAPMKNVVALDGNQAQFSTAAGARGNPYWDSCYFYMGRPAGAYTQGAVSGAADQEFHATFAEHNFTGNTDVFEIAIAQFGFPTMANPKLSTNIAPVAHLLNKWVGFDRGDVNNDGIINLADIVYLAKFVNVGGPGPIPFKHCGDVNASGGAPDASDVTYLINYYFYYGPCPVGQFISY
jgi:outer membrane protein assembly factor BamB